MPDTSKPMGCQCACHIATGNDRVPCTIDQGYDLGCGPHTADDPAAKTTPYCETCGVPTGQPHQWIEDDCILPGHSYNRRGHPPTAKHGRICENCARRHATWLNQIVELYATLAQVIPPGSIPDDTAEHGKPKKAPASPSPIRLGAWAMVADRQRLSLVGSRDEDGTVNLDQYRGLPDVPTVICTWANWTSEALNLGTHQATTITAAVAILTKHSQDVGRLPFIDDYDAELNWIRTALREAHGINNRQRLGACISVRAGRECGGNVWPNPGDRPRCDRCGRRYGPHDLMRLKLTDQPEREARPPRRHLAHAIAGTGRIDFHDPNRLPKYCPTCRQYERECLCS